MYANKYDTEFKDESRFIKKGIIWLIVLIFIVSGIVWFFHRAEQVVETGIIHYEEFQEIYNTCQKLNTDLGTIRAVPDNDKMFDSFSKGAVIANKRQQLARWVEEYNAKSKMINRSFWKSKELPYQLDVNQFNRYDN